MAPHVGLRFIVLALVFASAIAPAGGQETPTPVARGYRGSDQAAGYTGDLSDLAAAIDRFWAETFRATGVSYQSPEVVLIDQRQETACGLVWPHTFPLYCPLDLTIYLGPVFLADKQATIGDYAPITVLAHEWGHHVQVLTQAPNQNSKIFELQADCLAGVYTLDAENHGLLDPGDLSEAVILAKDVGDPLGLPQDHPDAHGINDERIKAFMSGYLDGLAACNLPLLPAGSPPTPAAPAPPRGAPAPSLTTILPATLPLVHSPCFRVEDDGALDRDALVGRLGGTDEARQRLQDWGWQGSANRVFVCDDPPEGEAGWVHTDVHLFADAASAQQAVDYFAAVRAEGSLRTVTPAPAVGDHAAVLSGPATNGTEFTVYASRGPLLVRVTAVAPTGIPFANALRVARAILEARLPAPQNPSPTPQPTAPMPEPTPTPRPTVSAPQPTPATEMAAYLLEVLPLAHAACFRADDLVVYDFPSLVERFPGVPDAAETLQSLGWQEGAYRQFRCADPPAGHVDWIDISVHRFQDAPSAAAAGPFYASTRAIDSRLETASAPAIGDSATALAGPSDVGTEYTLYVSYGSLLLRVTGVAPTGDPALDVEHVMLALHAGALIRGEPGGSSPSPTAVSMLTATPTPFVLATAAPIPTPTLLPTSIPPSDTASEFVYGILDLGTGDGNWSSAHHINERGDVLWTWTNSQDPMTERVGDPHPMLWANGASTDLTASSIDFTIAINDGGTVLAGTTQVGRGRRDFLYQTSSGTVTPLSEFEGGFPVDLNNAGAVAGWLDGSAVIATAGSILTVPVPPGFEIFEVAAINDAGNLAGTVYENPMSPVNQRAILFVDGLLMVLPTAPGADASSASDLNDLGQVVGSPGVGGMHRIHQYGRAFLYDYGTETTTDIGTLPGYQNSVASAINNVGQVVGFAWLPMNWQTDDSTDQFRRAFVYDHRTGVIVDLNERIPQGTGWYLVDAFDINSAGQIVGRGLIGGEMHAFVLTPAR